MKTELALVQAFPWSTDLPTKADFFWGPGFHVSGEGIGPTLAVREANQKVKRICLEMGALRPKGEWVWQGVNRNSGNPAFVLKKPESGEVFVRENNWHTQP